jgi:hypothetical protein
LTPSSKKRISYLLKIAIIVSAFFIIYHQILKNDAYLNSFQVLIHQISYWKVLTTPILIVLLMLVNWVLESFKWKYLSKRLAPVSTWKAIEAVFCGLTWAVFTPNRFGEYGGRVMFLPGRKRIHGIFAMAVGSFGQSVVTNVMGALSLVWFVYHYLHVNGWYVLIFLTTTLFFVVFLLIFYFNIKWLVQLLNRVKFLRKFHRFFDIMGRYRFKELLAIMWFCLARYFVFNLQYFLLIHLLIPQIPVFSFVMLMFIFFLIQSAIPSLDFLEIGVRSLTADKLFSYITDQHIAIIASVSIIYLINLIIPAIFGSVFVLKLNFFDRTS